MQQLRHRAWRLRDRRGNGGTCVVGPPKARTDPPRVTMSHLPHKCAPNPAATETWDAATETQGAAGGEVSGREASGSEAHRVHASRVPGHQCGEHRLDLRLVRRDRKSVV